MVKVASSMFRSKKPFVQVEIKGIEETKRYLTKQEKRITDDVDLEVGRNANYVQQEVQESIIGNRAEPKSVDTGTFGNSIEADKVGWAVWKVFPEKIRYPNGQTTVEVAKILEYGTSRINPRRHFRNTKARTEKKVVNNLKKAISKGITMRF